MASMAPHLAEVANLVGDLARANILSALMDNRALTAGELTHAARVSPQTTALISSSWRTRNYCRSLNKDDIAIIDWHRPWWRKCSKRS